MFETRITGAARKRAGLAVKERHAAGPDFPESP
jgi:hypothetical protein